MTEKSFLIDSNILIYAIDNSDTRKHEIALEILEDCFGRNEIWAISYQNLAELSAVIINKIHNKNDLENARKLIKDIILVKNFKKIKYTGRTIIHAIELNQKDNIEFWDALIAATMLENKIFNIYTENTKDFSNVPGIKAINPFIP